MHIDSCQAASMPQDDILATLNTNLESGLSEREALSRLARVGQNELSAAEPEPIWRKFFNQFKEPLILLLLGSATVSLVMGQYDDAFSITMAITIVITVAVVQEYRSEKSLEELNKLVPRRCNCVRDGAICEMMAADLVPGDVVFFSVGDVIPADCRLMEAVDLEVDEALLTGEIKPVVKSTKRVEADTSSSLADRTSVAYLGTFVRRGRGRAVVVATAEYTEFGKVFEMLQEVEDQKTPLQVKMDGLGKTLSVFSFAIIGFIVLVGVFQGRNAAEMFTIGVSLAVAAIPEGLPIVVTVTLALGVMRMSKRNAIVKKLPAVEALGSANVICSDKTGTLTQNQMTVQQLFTVGSNIRAGVTGVGYGTTGGIVLNGRPVDVHDYPELEGLLEIGVLCNNSHLRDGQVIGSATEGALLVAALKAQMLDRRAAFPRTYEIPFSSEDKWMAVRCQQGDLSAECFFVKGAAQKVLAKCAFVATAGAPARPLTEDDRREVFHVANDMGSRGLRVLALAKGEHIDKLTLFGLVGVMDPPRDGVRDSVETLLNSGVSVIMITGDMERTAVSVAHRVSIFDPEQHATLSGAEVDRMSDEQLQTATRNVTVFYRTSPEHKLRIVKALQADGSVVAMTGDGVNDALSLKMANIGIAMGMTGTDVAKEASDMILTDDDFSTILSAIEEGKAISYNIGNFLRFQLSTSVAALFLVMLSTLMGFANPLNAMQILWINILMDGPPAQSLGVEAVDPDVMKSPPRRINTPIITRELIVNVLVSASITVVGTLYVFWTESQADGQVTSRDTTMTFTTFVFFDMFNALSCRSQHKSILEVGWFSNKAFLYSVGGALAGQFAVIYFAPLQRVFQTEALSFSDVVFIIALSSTVFLVDEARKRLNFRRPIARLPLDGKRRRASYAQV